MPGSTSTASSATTTTSASTSQAISVTSSTAATSLANSVTSSLSTLTTTSGTSTSTLISTLTTSFATASSTNPPPLVDAVAARREEAAAASAAVEAAEERAVLQLLAALAPAPGAPPGVLGSAKVETEVGTVEVTAFSADAAAAAGGTVPVTGSGGVAVDVPSQVLGQAASIGGAGPVLLSFTSMSKVASKFQASAPNAPSPSGASTGRRLNALQSVPLSINLRGADGKKLDMSRLSSPMVLSVESFDPNATCAYWDEDQGMWSQSGVEKVGYEQGKLMCRTEHLSIFGALMESIFKDVAAVLKCSTAWQLVSVEGIKKIGEPGWTGYPPSIVTFCFLGGFLLAGSCAFRLDRRAEEAIPWLEREAMLLRSKKSVDRTKMRAFRPSVQEKGGRCSRCCRAVKNAFDYVVWLVGSSFGVENAAEVVSELVSNAPTATVSRCVAALHAHKSGACRESLKAVKDLAGPDLDKAARQASQREAAAGAAGGGAGGGGRRQVASRLRASVMNGVSVMMQNMDHFRVALQSMTQRWDVHGHGVWAVETFVSSGWCKRVAMLFPAVHPWVAITLFSMFTSHAVRAALIILKLSTSAASNALFFTSASSTPDSDAECAPPQTLFSRMVQGATVGVLSACLGDVIIFLLFMVQRRRVVEREEWTPEMKQKQVSRWWWRSCIFWSWWVFHESCCILYVFTFLANVTLADAVKWVESTGISLLQDLLLVPLAVSLVLGSLASLALRSARVRLAVEDKWIGSAPEENEEPAKELLRCRTFTGFAGVESEEGVNSEHGFSDVEADEEAEFSDSVSVDCSVRQDFCPVLPGVPT
ncbi:unnamed protein product [Effrenium voratum]|uniref:GAIN-B domain-containing protein n=1 Tax=Effrenium voratum TaxID=2562239 RepID=A0AA36MRZ7_9DINO|nr:unnamed protein product [Effrenium voratum]CAJ1437159.1 unnamed protein product [Effrenium voratum]